MVKKAGFIHISLESFIAILIALASLVTALAAWRTNVVSSLASDTYRVGLITAIKDSASQNEEWRKVYEEAGYARDYLVEVAAVEALEASGDSVSTATAANLRQYLLNSLRSLAEPLGTTSDYRKADGTFDTQKRFLELRAQDLKPGDVGSDATFKKAAQFHQEQRFLTVGLVLLATSLFWLGMAEISQKRIRVIALVIGTCIFLGSLGYFAIVEVGFVLIKGGLL